MYESLIPLIYLERKVLPYFEIFELVQYGADEMVLITVRTRWVDYANAEYDPSQIDPGWHAWMSYSVDKPPTEDPILKTNQRSWEIPEHRPNMTMSRGAFKTYST